MGKTGVEVYGEQKLMARLANIEGTLKPITEEAFRETAENVKAEAKRTVPVDTGSLKKSIRLQVHAMPAGEVHKIGVSAGGYVTNPKSGRKVDYASHVEYGTSQQRAQPYMRPAFNKHKKDVTRIIMRRLFG